MRFYESWDSNLSSPQGKNAKQNFGIICLCAKNNDSIPCMQKPNHGSLIFRPNQCYRLKATKLVKTAL